MNYSSRGNFGEIISKCFWQVFKDLECLVTFSHTTPSSLNELIVDFLEQSLTLLFHVLSFSSRHVIKISKTFWRFCTKWSSPCQGGQLGRTADKLVLEKALGKRLSQPTRIERLGSSVITVMAACGCSRHWFMKGVCKYICLCLGKLKNAASPLSSYWIRKTIVTGIY